jgi:hypothetical protein
MDDGCCEQPVHRSPIRAPLKSRHTPTAGGVPLPRQRFSATTPMRRTQLCAPPSRDSTSSPMRDARDTPQFLRIVFGDTSPRTAQLPAATAVLASSMVDLASKWITGLGPVGEAGECCHSRDLVGRCSVAGSRAGARHDNQPSASHAAPQRRMLAKTMSRSGRPWLLRGREYPGLQDRPARHLHIVATCA